MLARWDAGSESAFVKKMNATAKRFGMDHTTYTDPSGLTATTVSTATDQLKLARRALAIPVFRKVVDQTSYRTASGDTYDNWNHLVGTNNVVGVKTGTTTEAGGNLVFAAYKQVAGTDQLIVGVVLGQYKPAILDTVTAASLQLVLTAQQSLTAAQVIRKGDVVGYVDDGLGGHTPVVATRDVQAVGWPGVRVPIALSTTGVPHSAKAGTTVGTLTVGSGPGQVRIPVALKSDLDAPGFGAKLGNL
jgi:D-alanyl-D-alanine carboxypeptidase